jgi:diacylglycerol kinase (ATP)
MGRYFLCGYRLPGVHVIQPSQLDLDLDLDHERRVAENVVIFANPIAGRGKALKIVEALRAALAGRAALHELVLPQVFADPSILEQVGDVSAVICVGGDGTLQGVAEVLLRRWKNPPPILLVPLGTANLIAKHLSITWDDPRDADRISAALAARKLLPMDAARCNGRVFLAVAGAGIDAEVVHRLHNNRKGPITKNSYIWPTLTTMRDYGFPSLSVKVDGTLVFPGGPALVYVGNVREYGTGIPMLWNAYSNDGLLDVCVLPCRNHGQAIEWMMKAATGDHMRSEGAVYVHGRRVQIESKQPIAMQLDGEAAGHTPAEIELLEEKLEFIVPS